MAATAAAAKGSIKPGWLKYCRILSTLGAAAPAWLTARSMSSRYCRQLENEL